MIRVGAVCAGYGGLELALALAGFETELAWYSEIEEAPTELLRTRFPQAKGHEDVTQIEDVEQVDIVTAGFPCQPVSHAGARAGIVDSRWIIDDVCRVASLAGARFLILENVAGLLTANDGDAMAAVCAAMAGNGFSRWEWRTLRASDVGAPHQRKRWFCVAARDAESIGRNEPTAQRPGERQQSGRPTGGPDSATPDADVLSVRWHGRTASRAETPGQDEQAGPVCDRFGATSRGRFGGYAEAIYRWEPVIGRRAPDPTASGRLNPVFVEWMMGLPEGWVTDLPLKRPEKLAMLGNGVVPLQGAVASRSLFSTLEAGQ